MKRVLTDTVTYPYVDEAGSKHLQAKRDDLAELLRRPGQAVQLDGSAALWWTFAGGRINHTLKYGFEVAEGVEGRGGQPPAPDRGRRDRARERSSGDREDGVGAVLGRSGHEKGRARATTWLSAVEVPGLLAREVRPGGDRAVPAGRGGDGQVAWERRTRMNGVRQARCPKRGTGEWPGGVGSGSAA